MKDSDRQPRHGVEGLAPEKHGFHQGGSYVPSEYGRYFLALQGEKISRRDRGKELGLFWEYI